MLTETALPTLAPDARILDAMSVIQGAGCHLAVVVDQDFYVLGVVTDGDVRRAILDGRTPQDPADQIMNRNPVMAQLGQSPDAVMALMERHVVTAIPVVDATRRLVSVATFQDYLQDHQPLQARAVIMAGGEGRRLRPFTENTPKPMMMLGDKPLIEHTIDRLAKSGVSHVHVAVNYLADKIRDHLGDGSALGTEIGYLEERSKLGTAGALSLLPAGLTDPLLVMNGDIFTSFDFGSMLSFHRQQRSALTIGVVEYHIQIPYGVISVDDGRVTGLVEKPSQRMPISAGIYVVEPHLLPLIPHNAFYNMTDLIDAALARQETVVPFMIHEEWIDIGTPRDLERARDLAKEKS